MFSLSQVSSIAIALRMVLVLVNQKVPRYLGNTLIPVGCNYYMNIFRHNFHWNIFQRFAISAGLKIAEKKCSSAQQQK
jgi:hypothetical protein